MIYPKVALSSEPRLSGACLVLLVVRCQFVGSSFGELIVCLLRILFLFGKKMKKTDEVIKRKEKGKREKTECQREIERLLPPDARINEKRAGRVYM